MQWMVVAAACRECGDEPTVMVFDHRPTREDIDNVETLAGDGTCVRSWILKDAEGIGLYCNWLETEESRIEGALAMLEASETEYQ